MSLVQTLLLRSLIAWFWHEPYKHDLVRWGSELHDRFMLPHYVREDMRQVSIDLQRAGYGFELEWLEPFFEFRFPRYGNTLIDGIDLEMRFAIEPWHVLGEEVSSTGTARYVDSSVERVQVKVTGFTEGRCALPCLAAAVRVASDYQSACAVGDRRHRYLERTFGRRLYLSRRASRRPQLRRVSGEQL